MQDSSSSARASQLRSYLEKACNDMDTDGAAGFTNKLEFSGCTVTVVFHFLAKHHHTSKLSLSDVNLNESGLRGDNHTLALVIKGFKRKVEEWTKDGEGYNDNVYFSCRPEYRIDEVWAAWCELVEICGGSANSGGGLFGSLFR
ncbi:MAG: hypothetical protein N838_13415 [Thiohalocapsa sp. PB-PSB1]|nr:MAG: hypothetical protein N838_18215 [Thiohalocapsa sp. PB-PSB1]QQO54194.1 MAG: hypothetical protein N838_13415 [Thiohalocapsa sp. PB-PSB1]HCS90888.1 hypothetical protein [Chromatiaceae bacterium]